MNEKYLLAKVASVSPRSGCRLAVTFAGGFAAEIDLTPLVAEGPIFAPLADPEAFRAVTVSRQGVPEWSDDLDLSPGSLLAWCEAGRLLSPSETDEWIRRHTSSPEKMA